MTSATLKELFEYLPPNKIDTVFTHGHCLDGAAAAALVRRMFPKEHWPEIHYLERGKPMPSGNGRCVIMTDYCGSFEEMRKLYSECSKLIVIDHHFIEPAVLELVKYVHVDKTQKRSAATLVYEYISMLFPEAHRNPPPDVIRSIEEHDLFLDTPHRREVSAILNLLVKDAECIDDILSLSTNLQQSFKCDAETGGFYPKIDSDVNFVLRTLGAQVLRGNDALVKSFVEKAVVVKHEEYDLTFALVCCTNFNIVSDVCVQSANFYNADVGITLSLDLCGGYVVGNMRLGESSGIRDVGAIARTVGGGGGMGAAGFRFYGTYEQFVKTLRENKFSLTAF